ncbi:MAG: tRNA (adenosine(37)-N6)-threonylcarbamoyltransferase complex dimerization subunit type 1 TsaB [Bacteroidetes bacterium]|nr:tRNA (adenosine(37)-N6)-threonylcarbamoyltransferase complex dimerization subunit type 1 TsaB [Bacteroidota bacterium]
MGLILNIETATKACSVALASNGKLLSLKESHDETYRHSEVLTSYIEDACRQAGVSIEKIDAVAISKGPGSFTGLRIGVSTAKGICYGLKKPLISVPTLQAMCEGMRTWLNTRENQYGTSGLPGKINADHSGILFCPMIDARRMEVYCALYDLGGKEVRETRAEIINGESFKDFFKGNYLLFAGDGAEKCREVLSGNDKAIFIDGFIPSAQFMCGLSEEKYRQKKFENLASFEPFYLKDFIPGGVARQVHLPYS